MPTPSSSLATLRSDLGGSLEEFNLAQDRLGFIGLRAFPVLQTMQAAGPFGTIPVEQLLRAAANVRAPGSGYDRDEWQFEAQTFATKEYGHESPVDDNAAAMYADYFDAEMVAANRARDAVLRKLEILVSASVFNASAFTTTAASTAWSTGASATPIVDVTAAKQRMWEATGIWPNALIINRIALEKLRLCAEIKDQVKYTVGSLPALITVDMLKAAFDLPNILVSGSAKNTAAPNSLTIAPVWSSTYAAVARIAETNDIQEPCIGRTLHWAGDGSNINGTIEVYREEGKRSDIVRCRMQVDTKVLYTGMCQLISGVVA